MPISVLYFWYTFCCDQHNPQTTRRKQKTCLKPSFVAVAPLLWAQVVGAFNAGRHMVLMSPQGFAAVVPPAWGIRGNAFNAGRRTELMSELIFAAAAHLPWGRHGNV